MNAQDFIDGTIDERFVETAEDWRQAFFPEM